MTRLQTGALKASKARPKFKIRWKRPDGLRIGIGKPTFATKTAAARAARNMREWWGADTTDLKFEVVGLINGKVRTE